MKKILKRLFVRFCRFIIAGPKIKKVLGRLLRPFPAFKMRLKAILFQGGHGVTDYFRPKNISDLSPHAAQILRDLKQMLGSD